LPKNHSRKEGLRTNAMGTCTERDGGEVDEPSGLSTVEMTSDLVAIINRRRGAILKKGEYGSFKRWQGHKPAGCLARAGFMTLKCGGKRRGLIDSEPEESRRTYTPQGQSGTSTKQPRRRDYIYLKVSQSIKMETDRDSGELCWRVAELPRCPTAYDSGGGGGGEGKRGKGFKKNERWRQPRRGGGYPCQRCKSH